MRISDWSSDVCSSDLTRLHEIEMDDVVADADLAETLCCPAGQHFLRVAGLRIAVKDRTAPPLCWTEIYVSAAFSGIRNQVRSHRGALANLIDRKSTRLNSSH